MIIRNNNKGATNKGTFLYGQNIRLKYFKKKIWTVLYFVPKNCTLSCTKAQKIINSEKFYKVYKINYYTYSISVLSDILFPLKYPTA